MNTLNFIQAWDAVIQDGRYRDRGWTVKVDADAVFFPQRLKLHLQQMYKGVHPGRAFVKNCPKMFGFMGPLEIFSSEAVTFYGAKQDSCRDGIRNFTGEDGFINYCMEALNTSHAEDFALLIDNFCGFGQCANRWVVAFHPYKDPTAWFRCWWESGGKEEVLTTPQPAALPPTPR